MSNQDLQDLIVSLDKVWNTLDELAKLRHYLDALEIISENLHDRPMDQYLERASAGADHKLAHRVQVQTVMIYDFSQQAKAVLSCYEDKLRSKIEETQLLLSKTSLETSDTNPVAISTNSDVETCDSFIVDNSGGLDYYYY